ncbi:carbonic anhydrase [Candidatus Photodesmus katoptron]|uniref:Carbonic anhydrase n=1 Tax=Candidatus Photodesmus katoptron Akat1 TaxID=1236703 RepID=S3DJH8_9GAMM|nr:carbonate dehydratase [Candidatus Photodesmus katoptron]EPE37855.1 carbonic anhydrase [Candidatus Photodesmus katoptron Akat1]KEY90426.1 carbonic anhydrase [Candidatus Photodesmus katoptron]
MNIKQILKNNVIWSNSINSERPEFFNELKKGQFPDFLWIGCSDSRVPAEQITGLSLGKLFVHRNIANQVIHTDLNCISVVQYAVDILQVKHIIICGHYDCGGINVAVQNIQLGLINDWLFYIRALYLKHQNWLKKIPEKKKADKLCKINIAEQVYNLGRLLIIKNAWERGQQLKIHGLIYSIYNGKLKDIGMSCSNKESLEDSYQTVMSKIIE